MKYEDTPIGQVTEQVKKDMDLIREEVLANRWDRVIHGIKRQIRALSEILESLEYLQRKGRLGKI